MEVIDGENFASWLARAHPRSEIVDALLAAGRGLAAVHDAGMWWAETGAKLDRACGVGTTR